VSPIESFSLVEEEASKFRLKSSDAFVGVEGKTVRGDMESSDDSILRVRMQARFKPKLQQNKAEKAREKISRRELEEAAGRRLEEDEVRRLKRARREGDYHEQLLMIKVKNKHDKFG
jgi:protein FRG1